MKREEGFKAFLVVWLVFTVGLSVAVLATDQVELHRAMHPYHSSVADLFFVNITHLGDGLVPTALALLILCFRDLRSFLMMALSCVGSAIVVQVLKRFFNYDRPFMFKGELGDLHWVNDLELHHHLSFPSGHSTAAWAMCAALAVLVGGRLNGLLFACLAAVIAYSRVYLSQHFTEDILAGAVIGTATAGLVHHWLYGAPMSAMAWPKKRLFRQRNQ